ncbi:MAG: YjbQ family protein [Candidatus Omnitrophica bacterium]|nr:YjbQ family protein [Candidatus Omnitrophota bacterium]
MNVHTSYISLATKGNTDIIDITKEVQDLIKKYEMKEGNVTIFVPGSTGGITTMEFEKNLSKDIRNIFEKIAPQNGSYRHHLTWGDYNGHSHVRASLLGPDITVPFIDGKLALGTWQQVVFIDFDTEERSRKLIVQIVGC